MEFASQEYFYQLGAQYRQRKDVDPQSARQFLKQTRHSEAYQENLVMRYLEGDPDMVVAAKKIIDPSFNKDTSQLDDYIHEQNESLYRRIDDKVVQSRIQRLQRKSNPFLARITIVSDWSTREKSQKSIHALQQWGSIARLCTFASTNEVVQNRAQKQDLLKESFGQGRSEIAEFIKIENLFRDTLHNYAPDGVSILTFFREDFNQPLPADKLAKYIKLHLRIQAINHLPLVADDEPETVAPEFKEQWQSDAYFRLSYIDAKISHAEINQFLRSDCENFYIAFLPSVTAEQVRAGRSKLIFRSKDRQAPELITAKAQSVLENFNRFRAQVRNVLFSSDPGDEPSKQMLKRHLSSRRNQDVLFILSDEAGMQQLHRDAANLSSTDPELGSLIQLAVSDYLEQRITYVNLLTSADTTLLESAFSSEHPAVSLADVRAKSLELNQLKGGKVALEQVVNSLRESWSDQGKGEVKLETTKTANQYHLTVKVNEYNSHPILLDCQIDLNKLRFEWNALDDPSTRPDLQNFCLNLIHSALAEAVNKSTAKPPKPLENGSTAPTKKHNTPYVPEPKLPKDEKLADDTSGPLEHKSTVDDIKKQRPFQIEIPEETAAEIFSKIPNNHRVDILRRIAHVNETGEGSFLNPLRSPGPNGHRSYSLRVGGYRALVEETLKNTGSILTELFIVAPRRIVYDEIDRKA